MSKLFNLKPQKSARQNLRNRPTRSENIIWYYLRGSNLGGYKFRRQQGIGQYVVDFYCPLGKLAVEIDGDSHYQPGAVEHDCVKQKFIEKAGIKVVRFTDNDVRENLKHVLSVILRNCAPPPTPPQKGGEKIGNFS